MNDHQDRQKFPEEKKDVGLFGITITDGWHVALVIIWWLIFLLLIFSLIIPSLLNARR